MRDVAMTAGSERAARAAMLSDASEALIDLMFRLNRRLPVESDDSLAASIGWTERGRLTTVGRFVSDSIREYRFWIERGRTPHGESGYDLLSASRYRGLRVLEPGCGSGCNLLSIARGGAECVGLEPVTVYRQMASILAQRERRPCPAIVSGSCESLPFTNASFDVVLVYSAHQYMDVRRAIREMARVLRPGGQVQIVGDTLDAYVARGEWSRTAARIVLNTLAFEYTGRRLIARAGAVGSPVYPRARHVGRWMRNAGLRPRGDLSRRVGDQTCFVAERH